MRRRTRCGPPSREGHLTPKCPPGPAQRSSSHSACRAPLWSTDGLPGVIGTFDYFRINSDENLFYFIILKSAVFLKTFVPLRIVPLCLLWCPRRCLFWAALTSVCWTRHSRVGWAPSAFPWTAPQKAVWVPLPSETQHRTRSSRTLARSPRGVEASPGLWALSARPPSL